MHETTPALTRQDAPRPLALITGGGRGLGRAIAERLIADGITVVVGDLVEGDLQGWGGISQVRLDVSNLAEVRSARDWVQREFGQTPTILINNAGVTATGPSAELPAEDWNRVIDVNLTGSWYCSQVFGASMIEAAAGGCIITMSSISADLGLAGRAAYSASKGALLSLTRTLAVEWAPHGIRVNAIQPGYFDTPLNRQAIDAGLLDLDELEGRIPLHRLGRSEEIAAAVSYLISPDAHYITGQSLTIDGGYVASGSVAGAHSTNVASYRPDSLPG